ncbi:hypothetical protein QWY31_08560 [Cytophagales bacterium LB-30]|uniref:Uncharacterized protein n=1 Tax=Shiella aurantiaca TaxID=3058365 RepID=A0ABT8F517_9BACT|nr:hypothetical protein [Shiella aurantiaca]MDN4165550.1 hypothetical protein [Shiella aurantiaca]
MEYVIPWNQIEISQNDSTLKSLCKLKPLLKFRHENLPELFHLINLNNDLYPDILFYWPDNSNEPILEFYLNQGDNLAMVLEKRGKITKLDINRMNGQISLNLYEVGYTSSPFLNRYHLININPSQTDTFISSDSYLYFGGTEIPQIFTLSKPFEVTQSKYRLRLSPLISDSNIVCELTMGDKGLALAEKTDATGRVWYFVIVENNIRKSPNEFYYIDAETPEGFNEKMMGWLSSRYLKIAK